jgi:hypothetical protein
MSQFGSNSSYDLFCFERLALCDFLVVGSEKCLVEEKIVSFMMG